MNTLTIVTIHCILGGKDCNNGECDAARKKNFEWSDENEDEEYKNITEEDVET
jgi:hypothetical protein